MEKLIIKNGGVYRENSSSSYMGTITQLKSALEPEQQEDPMPIRMQILDRHAMNGNPTYRTKMFVCPTNQLVFAESKLETVKVHAKVSMIHNLTDEEKEGWEFPEDHIPIQPILCRRGDGPREGEQTGLFPMGVPRHCHLSLIRKYSLIGSGALLEASLFMASTYGDQLSLWRPLLPNVYDAGNMCLGSLDEDEQLNIRKDWETVERILEPTSFNSDIWDPVCRTKVMWTTNEQGDIQQWWKTSPARSNIHRIAGQAKYHHIIGHSDDE